MRRLRSPAWFLGAIAASTLVGGVALAAPKDGAALKLREQAIYTDYLGTNFAVAETKLAQALAMCTDAASCEATVRARLQCDLGAVLFSDQKLDEAKAHFVLALKEDPNVAIEKDLSSPELQRAFDSAKNAGQPAPGTGASPGASAGAVPAEDIKHTPPPEQAVLTPVPIYAEIPEGVDAVRVIVRYSGFGMPQWKTAVLRKIGAGWGGEIPCTDVGDSVGDLKYFIQATDANGDLVASNGRLFAPRIVHIVTELKGAPPTLPGEPPPAQCTQKTDCPPGFPGCKNEGAKVACESDADCTATTQECRAGYCEDTGEPPPVVEGPFKRNWLSVAFQADLLFLPSAGDACGGGTGYTCFDSGGTYYGGIPLKGADDSINGGPVPSTMRILVGYDRVFGQNFTAGARLGYAFNGGPKRPTSDGFQPFHAEARGSYWFGHDPLARAGFRFFALAAAGLAQVDGSIGVDVYATTKAYSAGNSANYVAWKKTGLGFGALGGGVMYALTPDTGIILEAKATEMFPTAATGGDLQLAYTLGL